MGENADLDFENKNRYRVVVRVKDAQNAPDTVTVNIMVTNEDEDPEITGGPMMVDFAENGTGTVATYSQRPMTRMTTSARERPLELVCEEEPTTSSSLLMTPVCSTFDAPPDFEAAPDSGSNNTFMR